MKILDLLNATAIKGGLPQDDQDLKTFLATPITPDTVIPDKIATAISGLMNVESAKNNPTVAAHFKHISLSPMDEKMLELAKGIELEASEIEAIKAEQSTYKKQDLLKDKLAAKITALKAAKKEGDPDKVAQLNTEISTLRESIRTKDAEINRINQEAQQRVNDYIFTLVNKKGEEYTTTKTAWGSPAEKMRLTKLGYELPATPAKASTQAKALPEPTVSPVQAEDKKK